MILPSDVAAASLLPEGFTKGNLLTVLRDRPQNNLISSSYVILSSNVVAVLVAVGAAVVLQYHQIFSITYKKYSNKLKL